MAKKLKRIARSKSDGQFATAVKDSAGQIWLAGLGAFSKAQAEGTKLYTSLIKEGEKVQGRVRKAAQQAQKEGAKVFADFVQEGQKVQHRAAKAADRSIADARAQATGAWGRLEDVFEDRVARVLHSLNVPTKKDIDALGRRVSELTAATKKIAESARRH